MRKLKQLFIGTIIALAICSAGLIPPLFTQAEGRTVFLGGMPAGFLLESGGARVVGLCDVITTDGMCCPARESGIQSGDIIVRVGDCEVMTAKEINRALGSYQSGSIPVVYQRDGNRLKTDVTPAKDASTKQFRLGVLIRDTVSGIGTVTYVEKDTLCFASLGHAVTDDQHTTLCVRSGSLYACSIISVQKGIRGKAGELKGVFINDSPIGTAQKSCATGIYGKMTDFECSRLTEVQCGCLADATVGNAEIYTTVSGTTPKRYTIDIVKVDPTHSEYKNYVIKVTDQELIDSAGGIVQGMSGSPIVQNGKLIGAVTHVFLNDPTRGYGIGLDNMGK